MKNYYAEFLQTKNSGSMRGKAVPKVPEGQNQTQKQAFGTFGTAHPSVSVKTQVVSAPEKLHLTISRMVERGASFDTRIDGFEICHPELLTEDEKRFIENNRAVILCQLQQFLLVKLIFDDSKDKLNEFAFDIREREAIIAQSEPDAEKAYSAAVMDVSKQWFKELLQNG